MKYAKFSDDFLSYFRLDDNGETLVLTDKRGYTRAVKLLPYEEKTLRCKDCKHQKKYWHEDKRMKEGGYWVYECDFISDPFESTPVCGEPEEYCSSAEKKGGAE